MKKYIPSFFLVLLSLLLIIFWFRQGTLISGGEEGIIFYNAGRILVMAKNIWFDMSTGFAELDSIPRVPFQHFILVLNSVFHSPVATQTLSFFLILVTGPVSMYFLIMFFFEKYEKKVLLAFIAALFYLLNPYTMSQVWGRGLLALDFMYAGLPLLFLIYSVGLERKKITHVIYFALVSLLFSTAFGIVTNVVVLWSVIFLYSFYYFLNKKRDEMIFFVLFFISSLLLWCIVNAWWFVPFIATTKSLYLGKINPLDNINDLLGESPFFSLPLVLRLLQGYIFFIAQPFQTIYSNILFQIISWIYPTILLAGIFNFRKLKGLSFFVVVFFVGLFVCLGVNFPLGFLFLFMFKHISFLQAFRNPYEKYGSVLVFGYTPIFSYGLLMFIPWLKRKVKIFARVRLSIMYISIFLLIFVIYLWPMWAGIILPNTDGKIGANVPSYYQNARIWIDANNRDNYRIFLTPFMAIGITEKWGDRTYNGIDSSGYLFDTSTVSFAPQTPYVFDFLTSIRKYINRINITGALSVLRTKFLIDRKDVIGMKPQIQYLTKDIVVPSNTVQNTICENIKSQNSQELLCQLTSSQMRFGATKYMHVFIKTSRDSAIELALTDTKGVRPRWDGTIDTEYKTQKNKMTELIMPLGYGSENHEEFNTSAVRSVEIIAHPLDPRALSTNVTLEKIILDSGKIVENKEFSLTKKFGQLDIFSPIHFYPAPELGLLTNIITTNSFPEFYQQLNNHRNEIPHTGFFVNGQAENNNIKMLSDLSSSQLVKLEKISETSYWIQIKPSQRTYVLLSKSFHPEWKLIPNVTKDQLQLTFLKNIHLLSLINTSIPETNHFLVNGYANLWSVKDKNSQFAIVFVPQLYAEIGYTMSEFAIGLLISFLGIYYILKIAVGQMRKNNDKMKKKKRAKK